MAQFGISTAQSVIGTDSVDTITFYPVSATRALSAGYIQGLGDDDIITLGAQGLTATGVATLTFVSGGTTGAATLSARLNGSAGQVYTASYSGTLASGGTTGVAAVGVVTANGAVRTLFQSQIYGNAGNDTIALGDSFTTLTSTTIAGGAGSDVIGNFTYVNSVLTGAQSNAVAFTAFSANNVYVEGGGGNDSIVFTLTASDWDTSSIFGGQGNDSVVFSAANGGTAQSAGFFLGGGDDVLSGNVINFINGSVIGGGGNDSIVFTAGGIVHANNFSLDTNGVESEFDGDDQFTGNFAANAYSSNTFYAGAGSDTIVLSGSNDAGANRYYLNAGNDVFTVEDLSAGSIYAGAGNDVLVIDNIVAGASQIIGGGGNDELRLSAADIDTVFAAGTVYGGAGADIIFSGATNAAANAVVGVLGISEFTDSTLSAMDTISLSAGSGQSFTHYFTMGGLSRASQAATGNSFTATNGVVNFTAGTDDNVTARVALLNSGLTTTGTVAMFLDGNENMYLFAQGGSTQTVVKIGDTTMSGATTVLTGALTLGNSNTTVTTQFG